MNFMSMEQVVMSGDGFYQSMAYHAFLSLDSQPFWLQCLYCVLAIGSGYGVSHWMGAQPWWRARSGTLVFSAVDKELAINSIGKAKAVPTAATAKAFAM